MNKSLHWDITSLCNLRCKHCYNAEKYFSGESLQELTMPDVEKLVTDLKKENFRHVHMLGGEPLCAPHFREIVELLKKEGMVVTINSNGTLLSPEMQDFLIQVSVDQYAASFDGCTAETNDKIRGKGSFRQAHDNMKAFVEKVKRCRSNIQTAVVFTLTKVNIGELKLLPDLAHELGVDLIVLTTFIESGNGKKNSSSFEISWNKVCDRIEDVVAAVETDIPIQIDMRPEFVEYLRYRYDAKVITNEKNNYCSAGESMWYMEADGMAHPCLAYRLEVNDVESRDVLAKLEKKNVKTCSMHDIETSEYWNVFKNYRTAFNVGLVPGCEKCNYLNVCKPCFLEYGDCKTPVPECRWTKAKIMQYMNDQKDIQFSLSRYEETLTPDGTKITTTQNRELFLQNKSSMDIWNILKHQSTLNEVIIKILDIYDVSAVDIQYDLFWFVMKLKDLGVFHMKDVSERKEKNMMTLNEESGRKLPLQWCERIIVEEVGDTLAVFDMERESFYNLNHTAADVLRLLQGRSVESVVHCMVEKYSECNPMIVEKDVLDLVRQFVDLGFIEEKQDEDIVVGCNKSV